VTDRRCPCRESSAATACEACRSAKQLAQVRCWPDGGDDLVGREARWALKELARRIGFLDTQTARLEARIGELGVQALPQ
jgi:hypothetical protein